ncbi:hypothetical protein BRC81_16230 [Halobacteriales archaeon QS_1_68_20]|nr:MAG: hypothetical protein BRC81_16230 [Halobacteriales archaeon QS_1_68_20]
MADDDRPVERESPVGEPVIRGDPEVRGERAAEADRFDPEDPESLRRAAAVVRSFAASPTDADSLAVLRGAAACAALVRGEGSYRAAAERAGEDASVEFIRKWARVHDLPYAVRREVATGNLAPTAAKHIARVRGDGRFVLAWATQDADLTVREVREAASAVAEGRSVESTLADLGVTPGELCVGLQADAYVELRRRATIEDVPPGDVVAEALDSYFG